MRNSSIKIYSIFDITKSKLEKEIIIPETNSNIFSFFTNNQGTGLVITKDNTNKFSIYKLEDKNLTFIKSGNLSPETNSYLLGKLDSDGNGYAYSTSKNNSLITLYTIKNYNFDLDNYKSIELPENNIFANIYTDINGKGFILSYAENSSKLNYLELDNFKIAKSLVELENDPYVSNYLRVSINKYGDGAISWNKQSLTQNTNFIKFVKDYRIVSNSN